MNAGHREFNPLRNIYGVISDAFKIFRYHKKIESILAIGGIFGNHLNKCLFYTVKGIIHYIIVIEYRFSKLKVLLYIGINAVCHHFNGGFCHKTNIVAFLAGSAVKEGNDLGNILCLIADSFHIGNHFKGGGNHTKVFGYGLLLKQ